MLKSVRRRPSSSPILVLLTAFAAGLSLRAAAQLPIQDPSCSTSIFGCQGGATPTGDQGSGQSGQNGQQGQGALSGAGQSGLSADTLNSLRNQRANDTTQVYVDSAGHRWDRVTPNADRNTYAFFPPDPTTDFQKLARSATGETVSIFGRDLFQRAPSTFAPADEVPVTTNYVVGPGDEILVRLWGADQAVANSELTVDTSGFIYIPRVGPIQVAGLRVGELQTRIGTEVNRVFRNYRISVSLGHLRSIQVFVVGEARRPGAYTISALATVLNALFASGGPNVQGSMRRIQVRRGDKVITEFDLYDLILRGDKSHDIRLETGDTLFIPPVGPQVALTGSVRRPAIYELKTSGDLSVLPGTGLSASGSSEPATTLSDLLTLAGGFSATGATGQIRLERIDPDLQRRAVTLNLDPAGRATPLRDGDVLYADHILPGYQQSVTIRGNLANPGRFAYKPGMRLSDIIPDRDALLTRDYWRERNRLGVPTPLFEPGEFNTQVPSALDLLSGVRPGQLPTSIGSNATDALSSRNSLNAVQPPGAEGSEQQAGLALGGVISSNTLALDSLANGEAGGGGQTPDADPNALANGNAAGNGLNTTGNNSLTPQQQQMQLQQMQRQPVSSVNRIRIPAPEIDWSYAVIERLDPKTLRNSLLPFNLGKLVQDHDPSQNLELQPGDVITVLNQRDILVPQQEQTKYVRLEGEFVGAGVYSVAPGETLDQLVRRAGGFTSKAYLYGSSFQRESARVFQQQRLDEYITRLSADMDRQTAVRGASTASGISDPNGLVLERNLVAHLRALRATGRVVLEFKPTSDTVASVPPIPLENGDVFRVPSRPNTVSVIGAVYGQNVFLYDAGRHLEDYLSLAGNPNQIADKEHAFIIRADGSIYSRERAKTVLSNHFDNARIYPGDSIVVPEKLIKPTLTRQLLDYSQILSSFGLAAAAIQVIE